MPEFSPSSFVDSSAYLLSSNAAATSEKKDANFRAMAWAILYFKYTSPDSPHSRYRLSMIFEREKAIAPSMIKVIIQHSATAGQYPEIQALMKSSNPVADFAKIVDHLSNRFSTIKAAITYFKVGTGGAGGPTPMPTSQWLASTMESWTRRSLGDLEKLQDFLVAEIGRRKHPPPP